MRRNREVVTLLLLPCIGLLGVVFPARATDNYTYKPNEYVAIGRGRAPDKQYTITAHGNGELGYDNFHLYLMAGPNRKKIGPLEEVRDTLDTGPNAFTAKWSPDSRHVAVLYRADRHIRTMVLYRVQNRRAYTLKGPLPLASIIARASLPSKGSSNLRSDYLELSWIGPTRFTLRQTSGYRYSTPVPVHALDKFSRIDTKVSTAENGTWIDFSADATCELTGANSWRIVNLKPGKFEP